MRVLLTMMDAMPVYLDDKLMTGDAADLAAALAAAKAKLAGTRRVIVEVTRGGEPVAVGDLASLGQQPVGDAELRLYSADTVDLALSILRPTMAMLEDLRQKQTQAADAFTGDNLAEGMRLLGQTMEAWNQAPQAVINSAALLNIDLRELSPQGRGADELATGLVEQLRALCEQLKAGDSVALADTLTYEWPQITDQWKALAQNLIQKIESQP